MVEYDAVVVGAGIISLSTAYHIKNRNPNAEILVVDKLNAAGPSQHSKKRDVFSCLFSSHTNFVLADSSAEFYRRLQEDLNIDLKLRRAGYLGSSTRKNLSPLISMRGDERILNMK